MKAPSIIPTPEPRVAATVHKTTTQPVEGRRLTIGMDMVEPFGVYVDGEQVAEYSTEFEARAHYQALSPQKQTDIKAAGAARAEEA
jgi:hypothetical protein